MGGIVCLIGAGICCFHILLDIYNLCLCSKKVVAEYVGYKSHHSRNVTLYIPQFSYQWESQYFEKVSSGIGRTKRKIEQYKTI